MSPRSLMTYKGVGSVLASAVGPGSSPQTQRLYLTYGYSTGFDLVAADVDTGACEIYRTLLASESFVHAMAIGADGNVYLGTSPGAYLLRFNPTSKTMTVLGKPCPTENVIWMLQAANDKKVYGCTFPSAKLFRLDPVTGGMEDLGRMDPQEQYARHLAASPTGFIYVGVGPAKANVMGYRIQTGITKQLFPPDAGLSGNPYVYRAPDGTCFAKIGKQSYRLNGWTATPIPEREASRPDSNNVFSDGRFVDIKGDVLRVWQKGSATVRKIDYAGKEMAVFRVGLGPDGMVYASTAIPSYLIRIDPGSGQYKTLGSLGGGEVYSFLAYRQFLLAASYSNDSLLAIYDPRSPWRTETHPETKEPLNPQPVDVKEEVTSWRPVSMIQGPGQNVYIGAYSNYGQLGGPLCQWDPATGKVDRFPHLIKDESVIALAAAGDLLAGGTTIEGGGGSHPTKTEATLFLWDPRSRTVVFQANPIRGAIRIVALVKAGNKLYGFAEEAHRVTMFVFDLDTRTITAEKPLTLDWLHGGGIGMGSDGLLWGLTKSEIFTIDPATGAVTVRYRFPASSHGAKGFALDDRFLYYGWEASVYRFPYATGSRKE